MGERKVVNKYYPPDFDPSKIPRGRKPKNDQQKVRMMMPMSVRCNTCGEYIYRGKKFNSRKETVSGEDYLGIKIFRFYMRCPRCSAEFTIKTDPKNADYASELNCSRNFEPWREKEKALDELKKQREKEEEGDAMKALENKTIDSKIEMDILDALDEIRSLNARNSKVDTEALLQHHREVYDLLQKQIEAEDEDEMKDVIFKQSNDYVRRIEEFEDGEPVNDEPSSSDNDVGNGIEETSSEINKERRKKDASTIVKKPVLNYDWQDEEDGASEKKRNHGNDNEREDEEEFVNAKRAKLSEADEQPQSVVTTKQQPAIASSPHLPPSSSSTNTKPTDLSAPLNILPIPKEKPPVKPAVVKLLPKVVVKQKDASAQPPAAGLSLVDY